MSPIIEMQRRLVEAGRIRSGEKGSKGEPRKLDKWRLTSKDRQRLDAAAKEWGGEVREWDGQWELYTDTAELPIVLTPESEASLWYELWSRGGCQRRCDGVTEILSDSACMCDDEARQCKPSLRFSVMLPDLPGIGHWLVQSHGFNAAREIPGAINLLSNVTAQGILLPARLRLEQRTEVKSGQTRRYTVPVIDIDVSFRELLGTQGALGSPTVQRALPSSTYVPVPISEVAGPSLAEALATTETQTVTRTARSAAPLPSVDDELDFGAAPVPVSPEPEPPSSPSGPPRGGSGNPDELPVAEVKEKLNALVGSLRREGHITTEQIYAAVAGLRGQEVETLIAAVDGRDSAGRIHWSRLREALFEEEIRNLHARLARLFVNSGTKEEA